MDKNENDQRRKIKDFGEFFEAFIEVEDILRTKLDPRQWERLVKLLDYHVTCSNKMHRVIPDDTPIPIAEGLHMSERRLRLVGKERPTEEASDL